MSNDQTPPDGHELFPEAGIELIGSLSLDEKLDKIIVLLEKSERDRQEMKVRLEQVEHNLDMLRAAYQQHGLRLGELFARLDDLWKHV